MSVSIFSYALLFIAFGIAAGYRPVIIVHGLFDGPRQFMKLASFITQVINLVKSPFSVIDLALGNSAYWTLFKNDFQEYLNGGWGSCHDLMTQPGTRVTTVDLYDDLASLKPMWEQVHGFGKAIGPIMQNATDGVHLICFSQGGLVCRGVLATLPKHNVHSLIFLSSPLSGQYGETSYLKYVFPKCLTSMIYYLCYNRWGQKISICNFWNDPHQRAKYLQSSNYLALLNGESKHPNLTVWRERFLQIKKLVLIGGPDDGVISPWQSSFFGFYDSNETVVEMKNQELYKTDVFGLRTLDSRGALVQCEFSGVRHVHWHVNFTVYKACIEKWLT